MKSWKIYMRFRSIFLFIFLLSYFFAQGQDAVLIKQISSDYFWKKGEYTGKFYHTVICQKMCDQNTEDRKSIVRVVKRVQMLPDTKFPSQIMVLEVFDSETNLWQSIYSFPKNYKNSLYYNQKRDFFSLNFPTFDKIILSGRDSMGFIKIFIRTSNNKWKLENEYRTGYSKVFPVEMKMLGGNLGYAIEFNYEGRNYLFRVLKTENCWKTSKEIYRTFANNETPRPDLKLISFLPEKYGKRLIVLKKVWGNKLVVTTNDFLTTQEIDFLSEDDIQKIQLYPDSTIYILTKNFTFNETYKIKKSTNYGKTWRTILTENAKSILTDFKVLDDMNMVLTGVFTDTLRNLKAYMKITNGGGKLWQYAFYINESDIFFDFKNSLVPSTACFKPYGHSLFDYNVGFLNGQRGEMVNLFEYYNDKIYIGAYSHYNFDDLSLFPNGYEVGKKYSMLENNWTASDISYPPALNYYELDIYGYTLFSPKMRLLNGSKYLGNGDTLRWNKIEGTKEYHIRIYRLGILNAKLLEEVLSCVTKDTFLVMPQLTKGYTYLILGKSQSPKFTSQTSFLIAREPAEKLSLEPPRLLSPSGPQSKYYLDTLNESTLNISWEPTAGADSYNLSLFEVNYKYLDNQNSSASAKELTPLLLEEKAKFTNFSYKNLSPNRTYELILFAENEESISPLITYYFVTNSALGIFPIQDEQSLIFPNPAENEVNIKLNSGYTDKIEIYITDLIGNTRKIWSGDASAGLINISLESFSAGNYLILIDGKNKREAIKLIKN